MEIEKQTVTRISDTAPDESAAVKENAAAQETLRPTDRARAASAGKKKRKPLSTGRLLLRLLIKIGVIALAVWLLLTFVLSVTIQHGNQMHPSVRDGDLVIGFRPQRPFINAAVLYEQDGRLKIGRVVALGGSTVDITENGGLVIDGNIPAEEVFYPTFAAEGAEIRYPYTVAPDMVFILNDFRSDTDDSRRFGAVPVKCVKGTLLLTVRRRGF